MDASGRRRSVRGGLANERLALWNRVGVLGLGRERKERKEKEDQKGVVYWRNKSRRYGMFETVSHSGVSTKHIRNEECISHDAS